MGLFGGTQKVKNTSEPWSQSQPFLLGSQERKLKAGAVPLPQQGGLLGSAPVGAMAGTGAMPQSMIDSGFYNGAPGAGNGGGLQYADDQYETVGAQGVLPEAQRLYGDSQFTPGMQALTDGQMGNLNHRDGQVAGLYDATNRIFQGELDPNINRVNSIDVLKAVKGIREMGDVGGVSTQDVNLQQAIGAANPAINQMLTGQANTQSLDPVVQSAMRRMGEGFSEQILPGIRGGAQMSGQYGGSRQGIAEGLAGKGLINAMGDQAGGMYNNAYNQAQGLMGSTANNMAGLGVSNSQANEARNFQGQGMNADIGFRNQDRVFRTDLANANIGFQNNAQELQQAGMNSDIGFRNNDQESGRAQQVMNNRMMGIGMSDTGNQLQDQQYNQRMGLLNAPYQYNNQGLQNYANIAMPAGGLGGTSQQNTPTSGSASGIMGGLMGAGQLASMSGLMGGGAAAAAAAPTLGSLGSAFGLMAMSDRSTKTDIEAVGRLDSGLTVYRYRYKFGGPYQIGVMADEVKAVNPDAVANIQGIDHVNYLAL